MKRSFMFWVYFVVAIILGIYFATRIVMTEIGHGKLSVIHNISITTDSNAHDLSMIEATAKTALRAPTRALDLTVLNNRISAVPGVRDVATRRLPNGTLRVRVEMHQTVAQWTDGVAFYPLAADGTTVDIPSETCDNGAIVFRGTLPEDISEITNATQPIANIIEYIEWIENRRWNIITTGGITVMLPETDAAASVRGLISLNEKHHILDRDIKVIDMRDASRILVK